MIDLIINIIDLALESYTEYYIPPIYKEFFANVKDKIIDIYYVTPEIIKGMKQIIGLFEGFDFTELIDNTSLTTSEAGQNITAYLQNITNYNATLDEYVGEVFKGDDLKVVQGILERKIWNYFKNWISQQPAYTLNFMARVLKYKYGPGSFGEAKIPIFTIAVNWTEQIKNIEMYQKGGKYFFALNLFINIVPKIFKISFNSEIATDRDYKNILVAFLTNVGQNIVTWTVAATIPGGFWWKSLGGVIIYAGKEAPKYLKIDRLYSRYEIVVL